VHIHLFTLDRFEKTFSEGVSVGCPGVDMLTQAPISSRCSTYTLLQYCLPRPGWWINPVRGWCWAKAISRACSGSCASMRRERLQPMHVLWSEVLVGGLVIFTIHTNLILNILDLYSFIVIYCDYGKEESYSTFPTGSALALLCFCAFPVIATEHPLCRFDEEPGI
jgi:hypothetical protein